MPPSLRRTASRLPVVLGAVAVSRSRRCSRGTSRPGDFPPAVTTCSARGRSSESRSRISRTRARREADAPRLGRAAILVLAFVAWAANQYWPDAAFATGWNDVAIALFVVDIFLSLAQPPERDGDAAGPVV